MSESNLKHLREHLPAVEFEWRTLVTQDAEAPTTDGHRYEAFGTCKLTGQLYFWLECSDDFH